MTTPDPDAFRDWNRRHNHARRILAAHQRATTRAAWAQQTRTLAADILDTLPPDPDVATHREASR